MSPYDQHRWLTSLRWSTRLFMRRHRYAVFSLMAQS